MPNEREKFIAYENVRKSGVTNMFDVKAVCYYAEVELTRADCIYIMQNYAELYEKYIGNLSERGK